LNRQLLEIHEEWWQRKKGRNWIHPEKQRNNGRQTVWKVHVHG